MKRRLCGRVRRDCWRTAATFRSPRSPAAVRPGAFSARAPVVRSDQCRCVGPPRPRGRRDRRDRARLWRRRSWWCGRRRRCALQRQPAGSWPSSAFRRPLDKSRDSLCVEPFELDVFALAPATSRAVGERPTVDRNQRTAGAAGIFGVARCRSATRVRNHCGHNEPSVFHLRDDHTHAATPATKDQIPCTISSSAGLLR